MKKILCLILCLLFVPTMVNADMGSPTIASYDVLVSNTDGAKFYNSDGSKYVTTIPYDTLLTITYEYSSNGVLYGYTEYDGVYGYLDLSSTKVYSSTVDLSAFISGDGLQVYVFREDCYMFSGPSQIYGKNGVEIPVGTTLEVLYYDEVWSYVTYNGVSGWIYTYEYEGESELYDDLDIAVAYLNTDDNTIITVQNVTEIYKDNLEDKFSVNIPELTTLDYDYYFGDTYHITYNGISGWVYLGYENATVVEADAVDFITYDKVTLYTRTSYASYKESSVVLSANYKDDALCWYETKDSSDGTNYICQISYNNKTYYIVDAYDFNDFTQTSLSSYVINYYDSYIYEFTTTEDTYFYDEPGGSVLATIPEGTKLETKYGSASFDDVYYSYVTYNGTSGWIQESYVSSYEDDNYYEEDDNNNDDTIYADDYDEEPEVDNESNVFNQILGAFIVALVIAFTAIVLTVYINEKKGRKNVSN